MGHVGHVTGDYKSLTARKLQNDLSIDCVLSSLDRSERS